MQITTPDGREVVVRRRLLPWRPRQRVGYEPGDASGAFGADDLVGIVLLLVFFVVVLPLLFVVGFVLVELVLLALVLPVVWVVKVALRRPWVVEVVEDRHVLRAERVRGWRASGALVTTLADELASGHLPLKPRAAPAS